jgi:PAS domain S-box-containing protein
MLKGNLIRIAVIDDDEDDFFILSDYIRNIEGANFVIDWCNNYQAALEKIIAKDYHLYFVDYRLGNQTGLDLLREAAKMESEAPIVLLTGKGSKSIDIEAMQSGATDYLVKSDLNTEKLERCIRYSLDRAATLKELKDRETKYRTLFSGSKDAVFIADRDLVLIELNQAASMLFGLPIADLLYRNLFEFLKDKPQKDRIADLLRNGSPINDLEIEVETAKRESRSCLLSISVEVSDDRVQLVHGIIHDITNIKKAEQVNLQAQKVAANERLMRILAHEIRNPLNNIQLSIDHLKIDEEDPKQTNLVGIMLRNCTRINQIITELLDLTKPLELAFEKTPLQLILDESIAIANDRINLQKIKLDKKYPDNPLEIFADRSKLVIAFSNIILNAVEAVEASKGQLMVRLDAEHGRYSVSIRDNGHGIAPEHLSKLFEPFFTSKKNGMGLGLAASYSIIQSHKGAIQVQSEVNEGTNFIISFNGESIGKS